MKAGDYDFRVLAVPAATRQAAARWAVYGPLLGRRVPRVPPRKQAQGMVTAAVARWRRAVDGLMRLREWERLPDARAAQYARNCPPAGFVTGVRARHCTLPACPFCHARRRVVPLFRAFEAALWPGGARGPADARLLVSRAAISAERVAQTVAGAEDPVAAAVEELLAQAAAARRAVVDAQPCLGGCTVATLSWCEAMPALALVTVLALGPDHALAVRAGRGREVRLVTEPVRRDLANALAAACRYPAGWLEAPPRDLLTYCRALRRVRMVATYGCLRRPKE